MAEIEFVGVDGCPCGWFSVGMTPNGGYMMKPFLEFDQLVNYYKGAKLILVDTPIGLLDSADRRRCDIKARKALAPFHSRVFTAPARRTVRTVEQFPNDYKRANEKERECTAGDRGITQQTFYITGKIAQVDNLMLGRVNNTNPQIREVHPEVCFWAMNKKQPISSKKDDAGIAERLRVLNKWEPRAGMIFEKASSRIPTKLVGKDDILDALVAAVTARWGYQRDEIQTLPKDPSKDSNGLSMEMVYWIPPASCQ